MASDSMSLLFVPKSDLSLKIRELWIKTHISPPLPCFVTRFIKVKFSNLKFYFLDRATCFCKADFFKFKINGSQELLKGFEVLNDTSYV